MRLLLKTFSEVFVYLHMVDTIIYICNMNIGTKIVLKFWLISSSSVLCKKSRTQSGTLHMHSFHYIQAHLTTDEIQFFYRCNIVLETFNCRLKNLSIQCKNSFIQIWMYQKKPKMKNTKMFEKIGICMVKSL